ncbi:MAG: hypothetical protein HN368_11030 [Spirochaetales bacterium]|jgi:hypothetical protein|nr:hypothetical protein [Spirochaetales bacterium]
MVNTKADRRGINGSNRRQAFLILMPMFLLVFVFPVAAQSDGFPLGWQELLPIHITAMSLSGAGILVGMLIARYRKGKSKNWMKQHKIIQLCSAGLALLGIATAVTMVEVTYGTHLNVTHSIVALVSFVSIVLAIVVAYGFLKRKNHKKELRTLHRWIGRLAILGWLTTIAFGLFAAGIL